MSRRLLAVAIAIGLGVATLWAAERCTFILTDGERISGTVAFHTSTRENLIDNDFSIGVGGNQERQFHYDQVAVIDFIGGTPSDTELAALPESGHMLSMRNGQTQRGHFVNMIGGDTVRWQDESGSTRDIPIRDVARIYLNPASAKNTFNFHANRGANAGGAANQNGSAAGRNSRIVANNLAVPANTPWIDSGIDVMQGDAFRFAAQGSIVWGPNNTADSGGRSDVKSNSFPVKSLGVGALIAKVGAAGTPFGIGNTRGTVTMPASGRLYLGVNDDGFVDNSGSYQVTIMRGR